MKKLLLTTLMLTATPALAVDLTGAGSSFVYPLFSKMVAEYQKTSKDRVNYQSIGSGAGQNQLRARTIDFAGSDVPIPAEDIDKFPGKVITVPDALGAIVASYNVPGVTTPLNLSGPVLADIYLGKIKTWADPAIAKLNPNVKLPPLPVTVVRRSDGSGTTGVFTEYLSKVSKDWKSKVGAGASVNWPVGVGAKGNDGVAGTVKNTPGSVGYIELTYALQNDIDFANVRNREGKFVKPSFESVSAAADNVKVPASGVVSITDAPGAKSYPISTYTYVMAYQDQKYGKRTPAQAKALKDFLTYVVTEGQQYNKPLAYAPLPENVQQSALRIVDSITYGGKPLK